MASFLDNIARNFPQIKEYKYDFETRKFVDSLGKSVDGSRLELGRSKGVFQTSRAGEASIRRGIFLQSLASSESSQRPAILEQFFSGAKLLASTRRLITVLIISKPTKMIKKNNLQKLRDKATMDLLIAQYGSLRLETLLTLSEVESLRHLKRQRAIQIRKLLKQDYI